MNEDIDDDPEDFYSFGGKYKEVSTTSLLFRILILILTIVALACAARDFGRKYKGIEVHSLRECLDHNPPEKCESVGNKWFE